MHFSPTFDGVEVTTFLAFFPFILFFSLPYGAFPPQIVQYTLNWLKLWQKFFSVISECFTGGLLVDREAEASADLSGSESLAGKVKASRFIGKIPVVENPDTIHRHSAHPCQNSYLVATRPGCFAR